MLFFPFFPLSALPQGQHHLHNYTDATTVTQVPNIPRGNLSLWIKELEQGTPAVQRVDGGRGGVIFVILFLPSFS